MIDFLVATGSVIAYLYSFRAPQSDTYPVIDEHSFPTISENHLLLFPILYSAIIFLFFPAFIRLLATRNPDFISKFNFHKIFLGGVTAFSSTGITSNIIRFYVAKQAPNTKLNIFSWPCDYASLPMASSVYISYFIVDVVNQEHLIVSILSSLLLIFGMSFGITRIRFHKGEPDDVIAGYLIGSIIGKLFWERSKIWIQSQVTQDLSSPFELSEKLESESSDDMA